MLAPKDGDAVAKSAADSILDRGVGKVTNDGDPRDDIEEVGTVILGALREFPEAHGAVLQAIQGWKKEKDAK
jgi:hypothetical protein